jgi:hypothetical protein
MNLNKPSLMPDQSPQYYAVSKKQLMKRIAALKKQLGKRRHLINKMEAYG